MYLDYWKLSSKPFENVSDVRFLFHADQHKEAIARLLYAVREKKSGAFITGPYGAGKTMVRDVVMDRMTDLNTLGSTYIPVVVENPVCGPVSLLQLIRERVAEETEHLQLPGFSPNEVRSLQHQPATSSAYEFNQLHRLLVEVSNQDHYIVLMIDQAHLIHSADTLEQLTMLMNLQYQHQRCLLTTLFFAHEGVIPFIRQHASFMQRIPCRWHIHALSEENTAKYISHRIGVAGLERQIFTNQALELIYRTTRGIPREINTLCDFALFLGSSTEVEFIDGDLVDQVCRDADIFSESTSTF